MRVTKDPETRREEILHAALEIFKEEGFEKASVESIAKAAGIAKGSFYNYFKTKEGVYEAVIANIASRNLELAKELIAKKNIGPKARLIKYIDWTFHLAEQNEKGLVRALEPQANSGQKQMYLRALDEGTSQMLPMFEDLLREGAANGEFQLSDPCFTSVVMLGAFRGLHVAFYNTLQIEMTAYTAYLYDYLSRLLGTKF